MARFDVFETRNQSLVVVYQSPLFDHLSVRLVVPLIAKGDAPMAASRLNPRISLDGEIYLAFPQWASGMPVTDLIRRRGNLEKDGLTLLDALDMLVSGV